MKLHRLGSLALLTAVLACEPGARKLDPASTPQSSTIGLAANGQVVSLDADHDAVVFMDANGGNRVSVSVGRLPSQLAVQGNQVGVEPHGVAFTNDTTLAVVVAGEQALVLLDVTQGTVVSRTALPLEDARGLAIVDGKAFVTHLFQDGLSVVDLGTNNARVASIRLPDLAGTKLNPSLVASITASPDKKEVSTGHVSTNNEQLRPNPGEGGGGYLGTPDQLPAVNPTLTTVDTHQEVLLSTTQPGDAPQGFVSDCIDCGGAPRTTPGTTTAAPSTPASPLLMESNGSLSGRQLNEPVAVAYLDGGRGIAVLGRGSRNVLIWRRDLNGQRKEMLQASQVGNGADGLAVSQDGTKLLVHNAFDLSVSVVSLPSFEDPAAGQGSFLGTKGRKYPAAQEVQDVSPEATLSIADVTLPFAIQEGRKLFFDATQPSMTVGQGVTCATCHAEGRHDGRTWQFIDGPRNTPSLAAAAPGRLGLATTTEPLHWKGELTTHQDLQRTITEFMGGGGLLPNQLDQVAAFIDTIPAPDLPDAANEVEAAKIRRGAQLFADATVGCTTCHTGVHGTDNLNHEVGTLDAPSNNFNGGLLVPGFQTPVLHGVRLTAPYLHDGTLATLEDVMDQLVATDRMGKGSHLSADDMSALVAYVKTL